MRRLSIDFANILLICISLGSTSAGFPVVAHKLINDTEAFIGKLFNFTLPNNAFRGDVAYYNVTEAGSDFLPPWLAWDKETKSLFGLPDYNRDMFPPDYHILISAHDSNSLSHDQQVFTIRVKQESSGVSSLQSDTTSTFYNLLQKLAGDTSAMSLQSRHLPPKCRYNGHVTGLLVFPQTVESAPALFGAKSTVLDAAATPLSKTKAILDAAKLFSVDKERVRLLDADYLAHLAYSMRPHLADLSQPRRLALFIILGCTDESSETTRNALQKLKFVQSLTSLARNHYGAVDPTLVETRLYRKVLKRRQNDQELVPNLGQHFTTTDFDLEPITPTTLKPTVTSRTTRTRQSSRTRTRTTSSTSVSEMATVAESKSTSRRTKTAGTIAALTSIPTAKSTLPSTTLVDDQRPVLKYNIGSIKCTRSLVCTHNVSKYNIYDKEDGSADRLSLKLQMDKVPVTATNKHEWFYFDQQKMQLIGLPLEAGTWAHTLTATDKTGKSVTDAFLVEVTPKFSNAEPADHEFVINLDVKQATFLQDPRTAVGFAEKLAKSLDDADSSQILINSIAINPDKDQATLISWSNVTLLESGQCSTTDVNRLSATQHTEIFRHRLDPRLYHVASVQKRLSPKCSGADVTAVKFPERPAKGGGDPSTATADGSDWMLATFLPAALVLALLVAAVIGACLLRRRGRDNKKSSEHSLESAADAVNGDPRGEFMSKGAPVIFPDEIERGSIDGKLSLTHTPALLKDERPPLAPPDFALALQLSAPNGGVPLPAGFQSPLSAARNGVRRAAPSSLASEDPASRPLLEFDENPLYRAPPPFEPPASTRAADARTPRYASPQRRDPAPYVPP